MANTSVIFAKLANSPVDVISSNFVSQTVAGGGTSTASPAEYNYVILTPIDGDVWCAFTTDGSTPNPNTDPRMPLSAGGSAAFAIKKGTKVGFVNR